MKNTIIIILIIATLGVAGGNLYYTASLKSDYNAKVQSLAAQAASLSDRLDTLDAGVALLQARPIPKPFDPSGLQSQISALSGNVSSAASAAGQANAQIADLTNQLSTVNTSLTAAETALQSRMDAAAVYAKVIPSVVRITDGQQIIGSGFIYGGDGLVVTANHVVAGLSPIYVITHDGHTSLASVVGSSVRSDVAVLRMANNPGVAPVTLADSTTVVPGDPVAVIGTPGEPDVPLGYRDTLTAGIVSQTNRYATIENNPIANLIQFDAPVNPGNSGGPVFDAAGDVIGMVIAHLVGTEYTGISWAVSSSKLKKVADEIIKTGSFAYPYLGLNLANIDPLTAVKLNLASTSGALVVSLATGGPAVMAGFQVNDVITAIGGRAVADVDDLVSFLALYYAPGDKVSFTVARGQTTVTLAATVGQSP